MGRKPGERWLRFAGLRRMVTDGSAICWTEIFVAEPYSADRGRLVSAEAPVYETIARAFGLEIQEVEQRVSALAMPPEIAKALDTEPDKPALMTRRRYFAGGDLPFEISLSMHPGDRYAYTQRLHREGARK